MPLTKEQKSKAIAELEKSLKDQKSMVFIDFSKVNSKDIFSLRQKLRQAGCVMKVAKKTLLAKAFGKDDALWQKAKESIPGQLAIIFGIEDEIAPAKITQQFLKQAENIKILGGIFESRFVDKAEVVVLSAIPSKEESLSRLVRTLQSPMSGLLSVLQGNIRGLLQVLSSINK